MSYKNSRYVAEIDIPEGYISIDCEIEHGSRIIVKFFLNQASVDKTSYLSKHPSEFKQKLFNFEDFELFAYSDDISKWLIQFMKEEFGPDADIHITDVDYD